MNVREGDSFVVEEDGQLLGSLRRDTDGVVLELKEPREGVALALLRAAAADDDQVVQELEAGSFGSVHLQTDDQGDVVKLVERLVPRVLTSRETVVSPARNGWIAVYDEVAERDPDKLRALGRELSSASAHVKITLGVEYGRIVHLIAMDRGRLMDEYVSVPSLRNVAPGDAIALRANPTVLSRLTGADPGRIRSVARTAESPDELPPVEDLLADVAAALGIAGAELRFDQARSCPARSSWRTSEGRPPPRLSARARDVGAAADALQGHDVLVPNLYELEGNSIDGGPSRSGTGSTTTSPQSACRWAATWRSRWLGSPVSGRAGCSWPRAGRRRRRRPSSRPQRARSRRCASRASTRGRRARPRLLRQNAPWRS